MLRKKRFIRFSRKGFTLPEVLVGISIMTLVVLSSTQLLAALIRSNTENVDTLVAYGLAQEGLEAVRNIRDSNWLLGANFMGQLGKNQLTPWDSAFPGLQDSPKYYRIDFKTLDTSANAYSVNGVGDVASVAPWQLRDITINGPDSSSSYGKLPDTLLYKKEDLPLHPGEFHYTHEFTDTPAAFHRFIRVEPIPYGVDVAADVSNNSTPLPRKYRVASIVSWDEKGREKEVRLETELTNWKEGY